MSQPQNEQERGDKKDRIPAHFAHFNRPGGMHELVTGIADLPVRDAPPNQTKRPRVEL